MRTLLVEQRCPTCGSSDLLEPFHASDRPVGGNDGQDEPGNLCVACDVEFALESGPVR